MLKQIVFCSLLCLASASVLSLSRRSFGVRKQCPPKPPTVDTLDVEKYLGKWYEQKRIPASFQIDTTCVRAEYGLNDEGLVTVHNTATMKDGTLDEVFGTAYAPDPAHPGELLVNFPESPVDGSYWILETDYESYSVVYSCVDYIFGLVHFEFAWILAREQNLDPAVIQNKVDLLASYGVDVSIMENTLQNSECVYDASYN